MPYCVSDVLKILRKHGICWNQKQLISFMEGVLSSENGANHNWPSLISPLCLKHQVILDHLYGLYDQMTLLSKKDSHSHDQRLKDLRSKLSQYHMDAFLISKSDIYQNEYVSAHDERLRWLTGFSGSSGLAIVTLDGAAIFVDGRYSLQVRGQVDENLFSYHDLNIKSMICWLKQNLDPGKIFAYDPWRHGYEFLSSFLDEIKAIGLITRGAEKNYVDDIWINQPAMPLSPAVPYPLKYAGKSFEDKSDELIDSLVEMSCDVTFISSVDEINWLLNMRGGDLPCLPVCLAQGLFFQTGQVILFVDERKITLELKKQFGERVKIVSPEFMLVFVHQLKDKVVHFDPKTVSYEMALHLRKVAKKTVEMSHMCSRRQSLKNDIEKKGIEDAHLRDGLAMCRFLAWLDQRAKHHDSVDEKLLAEKLLLFRQDDGLFQSFSFPPIVASGPHGAMIHYTLSDESNRTLKLGDVVLIDSGAQYLNGTTDLTRSVCFGKVKNKQVSEHYTYVLKGHIALACAVFPRGTRGNQLDVLARLPLWEKGLDYQHGTGHGVGCYLNVHEGYASISTHHLCRPLESGMLLSNEPGYYLQGHYGIRLENLMFVIDHPKLKQPMHCFKTISLVPFDRRLICLDLLNQEEVQWLDDYHSQVWYMYHQADLSKEELHWLEEMTRPLSEVSS